MSSTHTVQMQLPRVHLPSHPLSAMSHESTFRWKFMCSFYLSVLVQFGQYLPFISTFLQIDFSLMNRDKIVVFHTCSSKFSSRSASIPLFWIHKWFFSSRGLHSCRLRPLNKLCIIDQDSNVSCGPMRFLFLFLLEEFFIFISQMEYFPSVTHMHH